MPTISAANLQYTGVPTAEPQVSTPSRYQTERASPEDFGAGVGAATIQLGSTIGRGADQLAQTAEFFNKIAADDQVNKYQDTETKLLYGDPNVPGDTGFYGKKGEDAQREFPRVRDALLQARNSMRGGLANASQQLKFDAETRSLQARTLAGVGHHYVNEMATYKHQVAVAGVENGMTRAAQALARGAEDEAEMAVGSSMKSFIEGANALGLGNSKEYIDNGLLKIRGHYVRQKVDGLSQTDPVAAQIYFENNIDALPHAEVIQLRDKLGRAAQGQQAQIDAGLLPGTTSAQRGTGQGLQSPYGFSRTEGRGFGVRDMSGTGEGHVVSKTERINYYRQAALARGLNPDAIVATVNTEGLHVYTGDNGKSFGDFQLYTGGGMGNEAEAAGIKIRDPRTWKQQADFALDQMAAHKGDTAWFAGQWHGPAKFAPWAVQNFSNPATAAAENAPRGAVTPVGAGGYKAFGDSLAGHLINHAGVSGKAGNGEKGGRGIFEKEDDSTAVAGIGPVAVKEILRNTPDKEIKGQDIVISTGASNVNVPGALNDGNVATIAEQVYWAKYKGAKSVTLLGVADPFASGDARNAQLAQVAQANGAAFAGAIPSENWAADKVHTKRPAGMLEQVKAAAPSESFTATGVTPTAPGVRLASSAPDQIVNPLPKLNFPLPEHENPNDLPDAQVPGMAQGLEAIMKNVPADNVLARQRAVQALRKQLNMDYQNQQRSLRLHNEQVKAQSEVTQDQYMQRLSKGEQLDIHQIEGDSRMTTEHRREMVRFVERGNKQDPAALVTKRNTVNLLDNIWSGKITEETPLKEAYLQGNVTYQDFEKARKEFRDQRSEGGETLKEQKRELMSAVTNRILGPYAIDQKDQAMDEATASREGRPSAKMRVYNFITDMNQKIDEYQRAGKNPRDLFNSKNSDFIGSPENLKRFEPPLHVKVDAGKTQIAKTPSEMTNEELAEFARRARTDAEYGLAVTEGVKRGMIAPPASPPVPAPQAPIAR